MWLSWCFSEVLGLLRLLGSNLLESSLCELLVTGVTVLVASRSSSGKSDRQLVAVGLDIDLEVAVPGACLVVVVVLTIGWNAANALYELSGVIFCVVLVLVLVERRLGAVAVLDIDTGIIVPRVVVFVAFTIAWNAMNALYELLGFVFCGVMVLVLVGHRFGAVAVLDFDTIVIIAENIDAVAVVAGGLDC